MKALVTGVTGFVGSELATALLQEGHDVRGLSRRPQADGRRDLEVMRGDAAAGHGLDEALRGVEVAYYLIHSFESANDEGFAARDRRAVHNFIRAARRAGTRRVVYLGVTHPPQGETLSAHLASRLEVETALLGADMEAVSVRTNMLVSARNPQFQHLVRLIERLPVIVLPPWHRSQLQPLDSRDVVSALKRAGTAGAGAAAVFDVAGPETMTFGELMRRLPSLMGIEREVVEGQIRSADVTPELMSSITGIDPALIGPLMETAEIDLVAGQDDGRALGVAVKHSFDEAVRHALSDFQLEPV